MQAIKQSGWEAGKHVFLGLDVAASEFCKNGNYYFVNKNSSWSATKLISVYKEWIKKYPLISIEDGLSEDDWSNWKTLTKDIGSKVSLVGDDLFVTNVDRIDKGIKQKVANAVLIKLNQIGTLSETIAAIKLSKNNGYKVIISHRSGETSDTFISDLAVAVNFVSLGESRKIQSFDGN
jgi:enolase